jgi:drug/metabolite transporter (DMT)-like permease
MGSLRGLLFASGALVLWSLSPFFFTGTGKRVGPLATNLLRLAFAVAGLLALAFARRIAGVTLPSPAPAPVLWLAASGVIGLTIGDAFLYRAFVTVGPERTSQIQVLAPAATAAFAWLGLGETFSPVHMLGMALILAGVLAATTSAAAAAGKGRGAGAPRAAVHGLWDGTRAAVWSALFQGLGTVLARKAFLSQPDLDPVLATAIRVGAGAGALWAWARFRGPLRPVLGRWTERRTLALLLAGVLFGPLFGMLCYVAALKSAPAGIVTTITFMAPLLIIPIGALIYGTRIAAAAVLGTLVSLAGVALLGLG